MRFNIKRAALALVIVSIVVPYPVGVEAGEQTASGRSSALLLDKCQPALTQADGGQRKMDDQFNIAWCFGYIEGVRDGFSIERLIEASDLPSRVCIPVEVTTGQLLRVIVKYLRDHPDTLHQDQALTTFIAYTLSFPCPDSN